MHLFFKSLLSLILLATLTSAISTNKAAAWLGKREILGTVNGLSIELLVQNPAEQNTPLQVICLFEYTEGDTTSSSAAPKESNGLVHVDESLGGLITDIRKTHKFEGKLLETLLITPPAGTLAARKLLLIGLGPRSDFKPETLHLVGAAAMREALRLEVYSYSQANNLKDAGVDSPVAEIAGNVIQGALDAYQTQKYLQSKNATNRLSVTKLTLLTSVDAFEEAKEGIQKILDKKH